MHTFYQYSGSFLKPVTVHYKTSSVNYFYFLISQKKKKKQHNMNINPHKGELFS